MKQYWDDACTHSHGEPPVQTGQLTRHSRKGRSYLTHDGVKFLTILRHPIWSLDFVQDLASVDCNAQPGPSFDSESFIRDRTIFCGLPGMLVWWSASDTDASASWLHVPAPDGSMKDLGRSSVPEILHGLRCLFNTQVSPRLCGGHLVMSRGAVAANGWLHLIKGTRKQDLQRSKFSVCGKVGPGRWTDPEVGRWNKLLEFQMDGGRGGQR